MEQTIAICGGHTYVWTAWVYVDHSGYPDVSVQLRMYTMHDGQQGSTGTLPASANVTLAFADARWHQYSFRWTSAASDTSISLHLDTQVLSE